MKKLITFQIMFIIGFSIIVSNIYSQERMNNEEFDNQAISFELKLQQTEDVNDEVLQDLVAISPAIAKEIIIDEDDLEANFNKIRNFVNKKNKEIEQLKKQDSANEVQIAKLAVELADAQAAFEKAIARQRAKHKKNHKLEQTIHDNLKKAEQGVKYLNDAVIYSGSQIIKATPQAMSYVKKSANSVSTSASKEAKRMTKRSKSSKAVVKASAQPMQMINEDAMIDQAMDDAMMNDNVVTQAAAIYTARG